MNSFAKARQWGEVEGGGGGEVELGQFDKHFFKSTKKRGSARKDFGNFSPNTLKTTF